MAKRWITALLGASLAVVLAATAASAGTADITEAAADAAEVISTERVGAAEDARAEAAQQAVAELEETAGEEGDASEEECLGGKSDEVRHLRHELRAAVQAAVAEDPTIIELDTALEASFEAYLTALDGATTAAEVNAAFDAFAEALATWNTASKERIVALKPAFAELVAGFLAALEEIGACDKVIERSARRLAEGQTVVDRLLVQTDKATKLIEAAAEAIRDEALAALPPEEEPEEPEEPTEPGPNPRPDEPLPTAPAEPSEPSEPSLPDTGASAVPLLLIGLALITGGATALIVASRRKSTSAAG